MNNLKFLPISKDSADQFDIILVTGDAYVDHPSFGTAIMGRVLESEGFRVGIIAQPDWRDTRDFTKLGRPRLFFGVTSGNIDSMLNHYTANKRLRHDDAYSPGNRYGLRPNRAVIVYTNRLREAFGCVPIVLGGIEASMRRLAHYDYWDDAVRRSILIDSRADIIVYGMGERQVVDIAKGLNNIPGTVIAKKDLTGLSDYIFLPSYEEIKESKDKFNLAMKIIIEEQDPFHGRTLVQPHANQFVVQFPPAKPLTTRKLDRIYELPFTRQSHPIYNKDGGVPALKTVKFSITSHRGCYGECSFCSLYYHMGRIIQSRSRESIIREVEELAKLKDFKGIITDIGGPTANMYMNICRRWERLGACKNRSCIMPGKCPELKLGDEETLRLWDEVLKIPKVRKVFVSTGVRYDLVTDKYLEELCRNHVSGQLKVAPEHVDDNVLRIMNKPPFKVFEKFYKRYNEMNKRLGKKQYMVQYFISSHPGSTLNSMLKLAQYIKKLGYFPEQVQDFIPMPMTRATAIYYTGKDPVTGEKIYCAKSPREKQMQRALMHFKDRRNKKLVTEALKILKLSTKTII